MKQTTKIIKTTGGQQPVLLVRQLDEQSFEEGSRNRELALEISWPNVNSTVECSPLPNHDSTDVI